jgi:hypothetical protein
MLITTISSLIAFLLTLLKIFLYKDYMINNPQEIYATGVIVSALISGLLWGIYYIYIRGIQK